MLNSVEKCIANVKRATQTEFATTLWVPLLNRNLSALPCGTRTGQLEQILLQTVATTLLVVTP
jgi:hypothetical protein